MRLVSKSRDHGSSRALRPLSTVAINYPSRLYLFTSRPHWALGQHNSMSSLCVHRWFSTSSSENPSHAIDSVSVRILYGTTGGTAQLFAMDLAQALEGSGTVEAVVVESLEQYKSLSDLIQEPQQQQDDDDPSAPQDKKNDTVTIFLVSTSGVGEPPASIRDFYNNTVLNENLHATDRAITPTRPFSFAIFGLGNSVAHPNHYNVVGKRLHEFLEKQDHASAVIPLALGDDGDCLEDDFDQWQEQVVEYFRRRKEGRGNDDSSDSSGDKKNLSNIHQKEAIIDASNQRATEEASIFSSTESKNMMKACPGAKSGFRFHSQSTKYPFLILDPPPSQDEHPIQRRRGNLFDFCPEWYQQNGNSSNARQFQVMYQRHLSTSATPSGLHEIAFERNPETDCYETGDHFVIYPRNDDSLVEAYLDYLDLIPSAIVSPNNLDGDAGGGSNKYPFPLGLTVQETLSFCVDLNATPTPQFSRMLTNNNVTNYKEQIFNPRRTVLDLLYEYGTTISLEDLLYNQPLLSPRYYSIASSPSSEPQNKLLLTYRPIHYMNSRGVLRQGTCTSFMSRLTTGSTIVGEIRSNPKFRLPHNPQTPILMVAGGCGVAPIHSMLQERLAAQRTNADLLHATGKALLFLGFRDAEDVAYSELIEECLANGVLDRAYITTWDGNGEDRHDMPAEDSHIGWSCGKVTDALQQRGEELWNHFEDGGHTFLCGGARTFGAAVEKEVVDIIHEHGNLSPEESSEYLRRMIAEGRFQEDLAD